MTHKLLQIIILALIFLVRTTQADYVTPEGLIEISPGVVARSRAAWHITRHTITKAVADLYNAAVPENGRSITLAQTPDGCLSLYINTRNDRKNYINQVDIDDGEENCAQYFSNP
jgi:hypothetical protein